MNISRLQCRLPWIQGRPTRSPPLGGRIKVYLCSDRGVIPRQAENAFGQFQHLTCDHADKIVGLSLGFDRAGRDQSRCSPDAVHPAATSLQQRITMKRYFAVIAVLRLRCLYQRTLVTTIKGMKSSTDATRFFRPRLMARHFGRMRFSNRPVHRRGSSN